MKSPGNTGLFHVKYINNSLQIKTTGGRDDLNCNIPVKGLYHSDILS